jgi:CAAX prenyl protease-like protein
MTWRDVLNGLWVLLVLVVIPWQNLYLVRGRRKSAGTPPAEGVGSRVLRIPRSQLYPRTIWGLAQLLVLTVLLDWTNGWPELRKSVAFPPGSWGWIAFAAGVHQSFWLGGMVRRRVRGTPMNAATEHLLPHSGAERLAFTAVALAAGISEEFLFRGYVTDQLVHWGLPVAAAVGLVNLCFGVYHGYKSLGGMIRTGMVGLALAVPVLATGALLPAMIAHTAVDVIAGWFTIPLARRWGFARQDAGAEAGQAAAERLGAPVTSRDA